MSANDYNRAVSTGFIGFWKKRFNTIHRTRHLIWQLFIISLTNQYKKTFLGTEEAIKNIFGASHLRAESIKTRGSFHAIWLWNKKQRKRDVSCLQKSTLGTRKAKEILAERTIKLNPVYRINQDRNFPS